MYVCVYQLLQTAFPAPLFSLDLSGVSPILHIWSYLRLLHEVTGFSCLTSTVSLNGNPTQGDYAVDTGGMKAVNEDISWETKQGTSQILLDFHRAVSRKTSPVTIF